MIFELKNNQVVIRPELLLIPEFNIIWERDKSKTKDLAYKELSYIYFISDFKSVYKTHYNNEDLINKVKIDFIKDDKWKPDKHIIEAIKKYKELQETKSMKALYTAESALDKVQAYINNIEIAEQEDANKAIEMILKYTERISKIILGINQTRDIVEKEIVEKKHTTRGAGEFKSREMPKSQRGV